MTYQVFEHTLTLNMTAEMRDDIDRALILVQDTLIRTRSEFIRVACQYALDSIADGCGDVPVDVEKRKERVFLGTDELDTNVPTRFTRAATTVTRGRLVCDHRICGQQSMEKSSGGRIVILLTWAGYPGAVTFALYLPLGFGVFPLQPCRRPFLRCGL